MRSKPPANSNLERRSRRWAPEMARQTTSTASSLSQSNFRRRPFGHAGGRLTDTRPVRESRSCRTQAIRPSRLQKSRRPCSTQLASLEPGGGSLAMPIRGQFSSRPGSIWFPTRAAFHWASVSSAAPGSPCDCIQRPSSAAILSLTSLRLRSPIRFFIW